MPTATCSSCRTTHEVSREEYIGECADIQRGECATCRAFLCITCVGHCDSCGKDLCEKCAAAHPFAMHKDRPQEWCPECIALDESLAEEKGVAA